MSSSGSVLIARLRKLVRDEIAAGRGDEPCGMTWIELDAALTATAGDATNPDHGWPVGSLVYWRWMPEYLRPAIVIGHTKQCVRVRLTDDPRVRPIGLPRPTSLSARTEPAPYDPCSRDGQ